jgi:SAM-dependent methyltransferase
MKCHLCPSENIKKLGIVGKKPISVTSDSKHCDVASQIYICMDCGHIQKQYERQEAALIESIYNNYSLYDTSHGNEQVIFSQDSVPEPRSLSILKKCLPYLPETGRLLDFGSGNGAILRSAGKLLPEWSLNAFDIVNIYEGQIREIPHVEAFIAGKMEDLPDVKYDLITVWHVLEHLPDPERVISFLRDKLTDQGCLLLQVPDLMRFPFDLAVIDHCSHFTNERLTAFFDSTGLEIVQNGYSWTHNCNTLLLKRKGLLDKSMIPVPNSAVPPETIFYWANRTLDLFEDTTKGLEYSIFTAGTASVFLAGQFPKKPVCFVDEDIQKEGKVINGISIVHPLHLGRAANIIMPLSNSVSHAITQRLKSTYSTLKDSVFITPLEF